MPHSEHSLCLGVISEMNLLFFFDLVKLKAVNVKSKLADLLIGVCSSCRGVIQHIVIRGVENHTGGLFRQLFSPSEKNATGMFPFPICDQRSSKPDGPTSKLPFFFSPLSYKTHHSWDESIVDVV